MTTVTNNSNVIIDEAATGRPIIDVASKLKTGYAPAQYDILMSKDVVDITTQAVAAISALVLTGFTDANTNNGVLYGSITGTTNSTVTIFKDAARSASVATGAVVRSAGGAVTLAEANSSGISGTCNIIADAVNAADLVATVRKEYDRYDRDDLTNQTVLGLVSNYDSVNTDIELYAAPVIAVMDRCGYDNVDGKFEREALKNAVLLKNITLV